MQKRRIKIRSAEIIYREYKNLPLSYIRNSYHHQSQRYDNLKGRKFNSPMVVKFKVQAWEQVKALVTLLRERNDWDEKRNCPKY